MGEDAHRRVAGGEPVQRGGVLAFMIAGHPVDAAHGQLLVDRVDVAGKDSADTVQLGQGGR